MFADRQDAGQQLAELLIKYADDDPVVLAIPRGGVEIGYEVAKQLHCELDLIIVRKLPYPHNPEAGFGAIAEDGSTYLHPTGARGLSEETINSVMGAQLAEIERQATVLRRGRPLTDTAGRRVILVDDGIAMGSTMHAAIALCRKRGARSIIVATPVTGEATAIELEREVDEVVVLEMPRRFYAVAQVYETWYDVSDREALETMARWREEQEKG